ncbi:MAG: AraC family transcriptional regulator [Alphaproteobacteria bacterium]|nr:AraC family transcriptional regulator [Alphaproteobacteria bacterium]MBU1516995.1 AraC family transcriptional regulator [Alphaproteobacteria bacterium]MBU2093575.1 AraC family transcriptional regulator [Alphaproteobacteria bacterium]MBU2152857.1 AraC family transcriptional regulator [Alphaproteobacteria bacterium]MBU2305563.1 AraC family transcriptional regulator [Alphaproteobacteria bacterium]
MSVEANPAFRIEVQGPELRSHPGLYGAGEARCHSDPAARRLESCYAHSSIGVVVSGQFDYRSPIGAADARPGVVLFGNAGEDFTYRYLDDAGVRRVVVALDTALLAEVADDCRCKDAVFPVAGLRATRAATPLYAAVRRLASGREPDEEAAIRLIAAAFKALSRTAKSAGPEPRRVRDVVSLLDAHPAEPLSLGQMAAIAGLSRYHFIRAFHAATGETPRQYQIAARLRAAADRLMDTREPITTIAFDVGFNDISHFNATFRRAFGTSPRSFRRAA